MRNLQILIFFTSLFLLSIPIHAQKSSLKPNPTNQEATVKVSMSEKYTSIRKYAKVNHILKDGKGDIYLIKSDEGGLFLSNKSFVEKYTPSLKQVFSKTLTVDNTSGNDLGLVDAQSINGQPYIFGDYFNRSQNRRFLFALKIEANGSLGKPEKIAEYESKEKIGQFDIILSRDSSKVLIAAIAPLDEKKEVLPVSFTVLDKNLKQIWTTETTFPMNKVWDVFNNTTQTKVFKNFAIDNSGKVIALVQIPNKDEVKMKTGTPKLYKLYSFEQGVQEPKQCTLDLDKKSITTFKLLQTSQTNEIAVVGIYSTYTNGGWFANNLGTFGTFHLKFNAKTGIINHPTISPFSKTIFNFIGYSDKDMQQGIGIGHINLSGYHMTENDNVVLSMEQKIVEMIEFESVKKKYRSSYRSFSSLTMFNIKYDKDGNLIYQYHIPKNLKSVTSYGMSHILAVNGENQALIFNDHKKNVNKQVKKAKDLSNIRPINKNTVTQLAFFDATGKQKNSTLFSYTDSNFVVQPDVYFQYAPGVVLTMGVDGNDFKLIKIEY